MSGPPATTAELDRELPDGIDRVLKLRDRVRDVCGSLGPDQLAWRPGEDEWSVGEVLMHLVENNRLYLPKIEEAMEKGRARGKTGQGPFRYGWFSRWFIAQVEPPPKRKVPAPRAFRPPAREAPGDIVDRHEATLDRLVDLMRGAGGLDLVAIKVASPVSPLIRVNLGAAFRLIAAHTDRHLAQIRRVISSPGFPASS